MAASLWNRTYNSSPFITSAWRNCQSPILLFITGKCLILVQPHTPWRKKESAILKLIIPLVGALCNAIYQPFIIQTMQNFRIMQKSLRFLKSSVHNVGFICLVKQYCRYISQAAEQVKLFRWCILIFFSGTNQTVPIWKSHLYLLRSPQTKHILHHRLSVSQSRSCQIVRNRHNISVSIFHIRLHGIRKHSCI